MDRVSGGCTGRESPIEIYTEWRTGGCIGYESQVKLYTHRGTDGCSGCVTESHRIIIHGQEDRWLQWLRQLHRDMHMQGDKKE